MNAALDRYITILLVLAMASICLLNLNGVGVMLIGINQLFSPLLLLSAFAIIGICFLRNTSLSNIFLLYLLSMVSYLIIGGLAAVFSSDNQIAGVPMLLFRYFTGVIITLAAFYAVSCCLKTRLEPLKVLLILTIIATFFIPFGHLLNISGRIIVDSQRGAGLFGNPNEAGIIAAVGFVITLIYVKRRILQLALSGFFIGMAVLTFSKAVLAMIFMIYMLNQVFKGSLSTSVTRLFVIGIVVYGVLMTFRTEIVNQFEGNQAARIEQFLQILAFEPSKESVESSRGYLWKQGMAEIAKSPIVGNGLGALHSMDGANAAVNGGYAQGVHNSYLLKFGDAGIVAFFLFLAFVFMVIYQSFKLARQDEYARFCFFYFLIFALDCMVTHNVELLRFHNFLIGFSLGLLSLAQKRVYMSR